MDSATASACTGAAHAAVYSIRNHFAPGSAVLLTGASGYIGSLVLEKLLRSTDVGHVYLLMRGRRGTSPADRLARLLQGPLFHLIDPAQVADRVSVVAGDILEPGLGLSPADEAVLLERVDTVIHSAAGGLHSAEGLPAPVLRSKTLNIRCTPLPTVALRHSLGGAHPHHA